MDHGLQPLALTVVAQVEHVQLAGVTLARRHRVDRGQLRAVPHGHHRTDPPADQPIGESLGHRHHGLGGPLGAGDHRLHGTTEDPGPHSGLPGEVRPGIPHLHDQRGPTRAGEDPAGRGIGQRGHGGHDDVRPVHRQAHRQCPEGIDDMAGEASDAGGRKGTGGPGAMDALSPGAGLRLPQPLR